MRRVIGGQHRLARGRGQQGKGLARLGLRLIIDGGQRGQIGRAMRRVAQSRISASKVAGTLASTAPGVSVRGISVSAIASAAPWWHPEEEVFAAAPKPGRQGGKPDQRANAFQHPPTIQFDHHRSPLHLFS
jgi:hypothetical protein